MRREGDVIVGRLGGLCISTRVYVVFPDVVSLVWTVVRHVVNRVSNPHWNLIVSVVIRDILNFSSVQIKDQYGQVKELFIPLVDSRNVALKTK